jgi:S1-C subfamily serine protease
MDDSPAEKAGIQEGDIITHLDGHNLLDPLPGDEEEELDEYESLPVQRLMALARKLEDGQEVEVRYLRDGSGKRVTLEAAELDDTLTTFSSGDFPRGIVMRVDPKEGRSWTLRMPEHDEWSRNLEGLEDLHIDVPEIHLEGIGEGWSPGGRGIQIFRGGDRMALNLSGGFSQGLSLGKLTPELGAYFSTDTGVLVLDVEEDSELGLRPGDVILSIDGRDVQDQGDVIRILWSYEDGEPVAFRIMRHGQETRVQGTAG